MSIRTSDMEQCTCTGAAGYGHYPKKKPFDWYFWLLIIFSIIAIVFVIWRIMTL